MSEKGDIRPAKNKSAVLNCIIQADHSQPGEAPIVDVKIFDGPALVNMLQPSNCKTFHDYAKDVFTAYIRNQSQSVCRVDLVWDRYFDDSLKGRTRSNRGVGIRRKVTSNGILPKNWATFLRCSENKKELFPYLSRHVIDEATSTKQFVATHDENVLYNNNIDASDMMPCTIEEADERIFGHANHAAKTYSRLLIKTVDSDVIIIAVAAFHRIRGLTELWVEFGVGKSLRFIPVHEIASGLGKAKSNAFLFFHAVSGCDTNSSVAGKGKKSFYDAWDLLPSVTTVFEKLVTISDREEILTEDYKLLERYFVVLYSPTCNTDNVNIARRLLFSQGRSIENIPPTAASIKQHVLRAALQGSRWYRCLEKGRTTVDPTLWGWKRSGTGYIPFWSELPEASVACRVLTKCGCKLSCKGRCKCSSQELPCTELCRCAGQCAN